MDDRPPAATPRLAAAAWYVFAAALALGLAGFGYRLDAHDFRVPLLYYDPRGLETDTLLILPMVKATINRGSHWRCEHLGAPGIQEMHDFPVVDHLHFAALWAIGKIVGDPVVAFNAYFLLTFPLTAVTAVFVFRHFGLSFRAAVTGGVLYAMAPYHLYRGENHYFLSAYFLVPLTIMVALWVCRGRLPFFPGEPGRRRFAGRDRTTLAAAAVCAATASAGAYYAFFACGILASAGLYGWAACRTRKAAASAGLLVGIVVAGGVLNHAPAFGYQAKFGRHSAPTERSSEEAEFYGLKLAQLVLPIDDHSFIPMAFVKSAYNSADRPVQAWTERYSLGTVGTVGLLVLLARTAFPFPRRWPYAPLAALTLCSVLIGTVGGIGAVFNHVVTPQVRCYNRIAIYIAFLCLFAVLRAADEITRRLEARNPRHFVKGKLLPLGIWVGLGWFGVWDQTPFYWGGDRTVAYRQDQAKRFHADRAFFAEIEDTLNPDRAAPGPMVFQLPYVPWPESPPVHQLASYEHARGYLLTDTLRWSFGCMKGREVDEWYRKVAVLPVEQMLERLVKAGFEGLVIDRRGFTPARADALIAQVGRTLGGAKQLAHPDGKQLFFDLRPHRDWLRRQLGRAWDDECRKELNPVQILWLHGFTSFREAGYEWQHRWCGGHGVAVFVNPTAEARTVSAHFVVRTDFAAPCDVTITGGDLWTETLTIDKTSPPIDRAFVVPPGRHTVTFRCRPPADYIPTDSRQLLFWIAGLKAD